MIVRSSSASRREGRVEGEGLLGAGRVDGTGRVEGEGRGGRGVRHSQRVLSSRAMRVRNACVCHAAVRLGLPVPTDAELRELPGDAALGEAVEWWKRRAPGVGEVEGSGAGVSLALRAAVVVGVTLMGLAFSYGQAQ